MDMIDKYRTAIEDSTDALLMLSEHYNGESRNYLDVTSQYIGYLESLLQTPETGFKRGRMEIQGIFVYFSSCKMCHDFEVTGVRDERDTWEITHENPITKAVCQSFYLSQR